MPSGLRQASGVGLGIGSLNGPGKSSFGFTGGMGNFFALDAGQAFLRAVDLAEWWPRWLRHPEQTLLADGSFIQPRWSGWRGFGPNGQQAHSV